MSSHGTPASTRFGLLALLMLVFPSSAMAAGFPARALPLDAPRANSVGFGPSAGLNLDKNARFWDSAWTTVAT